MSHFLRIFVLCMVAMLPAVARAQSPDAGGEVRGNSRAPDRAEYTPDAFKDIGVDEKLGQTIPLNLVFKDESGRQVTLGDYFNRGKPVILQLAYFGCPMLCGQVSEGMVESLKELSLGMESDYEVITLSFDPSEHPGLASAKKRSFKDAYTRPGVDGGWHFLTGDPAPIKAITSAVGFNYKWVESQRQFSHPAVLVLLTPDGRISRYLYGVKFDQQTLRLSLVEASEGRIGTAMDQIILTCLMWSGGKYTVAARSLMKLAGATMVVVMGVVGLRLFLMERRRSAERLRAVGGLGR
jgi:protein SCO1/2